MQSLSSFCGNLYKKYPTIELVGLLQYVANTLKSGQSLQLLLLRDLVTKMAGIELLEDVSRDQLEAQAGGETLKLSVTDVLGIAKNTKRSSTRLKDALVRRRPLAAPPPRHPPHPTPARPLSPRTHAPRRHVPPPRFAPAALLAPTHVLPTPAPAAVPQVKNGLAVPLFLLIAQQRGACVFRNDTPHLKVLAGLLPPGTRHVHLCDGRGARVRACACARARACARACARARA